MSDRRLVYAAGSLRAVAAATTGVALGAYLTEMDVPTRQSYVIAVVRPKERTVASGT